MAEHRGEKHGLKKTLLAAAVVIGSGTLLFQGLTQAATEIEGNRSSTVPTSYASVAGDPPPAAQSGLPEGYRKANYSVGAIDLEYYLDQAPTSKDMNREEAAEIGARTLWEIFGLDLEDQAIEIGYQRATESLPRSNWYADVLIEGQRTYSFSVDSVTGELFSAGWARTLDNPVSVAFDAALQRNPQEYVDLAKRLAEKYNVVNGAVKTAEYNGQGYSGNDPTISVNVTGENGEIALMSFSRYDRALLGIVYDGMYKPSLEAHKKSQQRILQENPAPPARGQDREVVLQAVE